MDKSVRFFDSLAVELFWRATECHSKSKLEAFSKDLLVLAEAGCPKEDMQRLKRASTTHYFRSTRKLAEEGLKANSQRPRDVKLSGLQVLCEDALAVNNTSNMVYDGAESEIQKIREIYSKIIELMKIENNQEAPENTHAKA